jgi:hypothetical protein
MLELPQVAYSSGDIIVWRRCQKSEDEASQLQWLYAKSGLVWDIM